MQVSTRLFLAFGFAIAREPADYERARTNYGKARAGYGQAAEALAKVNAGRREAIPASEQEVLDQIQANQAKAFPAIDQLMTLLEHGKKDEAGKYILGAQMTRRDDEQMGMIAHTVVVAMRIQVLFVGLAALLGLAASLLVTRAIVRGLGGEPQDAADLVRRIADGDLSVAVHLRPGDDRSMMYAMKTMQESLARVVSQTQQVVDAARRGDFQQRIEVAGNTGFILALGSSLNQLTATCKQGLDDVVRVLQAAAQGNLAERISADYEGEFARLKLASNTTLEKLAERSQVAAEEISQSVQQNAAASEELASTSEEVNAQALKLQASMEFFTLAGDREPPPRGLPKASAKPPVHRSGLRPIARGAGKTSGEFTRF
jgi:methyl-accepting chemotaxis protein